MWGLESFQSWRCRLTSDMTPSWRVQPPASCPELPSPPCFALQPPSRRASAMTSSQATYTRLANVHSRLRLSQLAWHRPAMSLQRCSASEVPGWRSAAWCAAAAPPHSQQHAFDNWPCDRDWMHVQVLHRDVPAPARVHGGLLEKRTDPELGFRRGPQCEKYQGRRTGSSPV